MRSRMALVFFGLLTPLMIGLAELTAKDPASPDKPYYYKVRMLDIPFSLDPDKSRGRPVEIRLFASENNGPLDLVSKIKVGKEKLIYRSDRDGRFAFAVQVVREGEIFEPPTRELQPAMYVIIDTQPPRAVMRSRLESDGSAGVEWDIVDENLDTRSISLEYRWPEQADWLPFDPKASYRARDTMSWDLKPGQKIEVRIKAKDLAGNEIKTPGVFTPPQVNDNKFNDAMKEQGGSPLNSSRSTLFYVNSEAIKLNLDVQVGPSGLSSVDLYVLTDRPGDWTLDKQASKKYSPGEEGSRSGTQSLTYNADKDGKYGFYIVAKNRAGVGGPTPKKGDLPRVEVIRDRQIPDLKIKDVRVRANGDRGALVDIEWEAKDANMAPQPIEILYCTDEQEKLDNNWKLVQDQLENGGKYTWPVPNEVYQFRLRLRAKDRAENVAETTYEKLVIVDLVPPSVDIKDAGPGGSEGKRKER